jgi:small basic protein
MSQEARLAELRELFLAAPESTSTRALAIFLSLLLVGVVLALVRRRTLREEYTPIWLGVAGTIALLSLFHPLLEALTRAIGAWTVSSALFFFGQLFLLAICLNYAARALHNEKVRDRDRRKMVEGQRRGDGLTPGLPAKGPYGRRAARPGRTCPHRYRDRGMRGAAGCAASQAGRL